MRVYSCAQWALLFFFYSFCGWIWESCYVSACQRRWVNRGFLQGPLLPIYGSGAILILFATLPVQASLPLVWLFGMLAATALEYVTGDVMERIFQVRYWDYSRKKCNLNGHICLSSSIAWGFFSILLVRFLHPPVDRLLCSLSHWLGELLALALTAAFTVDAVRSVQAALDLKETLARLAEENEDLRRLARRAEVAAAFAEDDLRRFRERTEVETLLLRSRVEKEVSEYRQAQQRRKLRRREKLDAALRRRTDAKLEALDAITAALENCREHLEELPDMTAELLESRRADLGELLERVRERRTAVRQRSGRPYHRALRILRANPSAIARGFEEVMERLRGLDDDD